MLLSWWNSGIHMKMGKSQDGLKTIYLILNYCDLEAVIINTEYSKYV